MTTDNKIYDVIIIGAGPAGMTAAIYCARSELDVLLLDKNSPGGKVITTATVENYPGYKNITGPELGYKMFEQCLEYSNIKFEIDEILNIDTKTNNNYKILEGNNGKKYFSKTVIIATGMINRKINIPNETELFNKGISYCAICDGTLYKNQPIAVIGSGRSAVEESIFLSKIASEVHLIANKPKFKADDLIINELKEISNIKVYMQHDTLKFNGTDKLESITLKSNEKEFNLNVNAAFIFIGFIPCCPTVDNNSILDKDSNFLKPNSHMETIIPGIFSAGDINTKSFRQISTAVGDGTIAALAVTEYLK